MSGREAEKWEIFCRAFNQAEFNYVADESQAKRSNLDYKIAFWQKKLIKLKLNTVECS